MGKFKKKVYHKKYTNDQIYNNVNLGFTLKSSAVPLVLTVTACAIFATQVLYPLINFTTQDLTSVAAQHTAIEKISGFREFQYSELQRNVLGSTNNSEQVQEKFYISIPKLNIENAEVETNSSNLNPETALGHYLGSALPGQNGTAFVYGHSVLPFFYNPKNYKTIFSTLGDLEKGDLIYVIYGNRSYTYEVEGQRELKPEEVNPIENIKPEYLRKSSLVLMTCSPPGTKLKRLLIDSVLINTSIIQQNSIE